MSEYKTVDDLLDAMLEQLECENDYQIAKRLKISPATMSSWRRGDRAPVSAQHALMIAEVLQISPALVLAIGTAAQSKEGKIRDAWTQVVEQIARAGLTAIVGMSFVAGGYTPPATADAPAMHIKSNRRRGAKPSTQVAQSLTA